MGSRRRPRLRGRRISVLGPYVVVPLIGVSLAGTGNPEDAESEEPREGAEGSSTFSTIGRGINELIEAHATLLECQPTTCLFVCECENGDCQGQIEMTLQRYRLIRQDSSCFMVVDGHESPDDWIARREASWLIVQKSGRSKGSARNGRRTGRSRRTGEKLSGES